MNLGALVQPSHRADNDITVCAVIDDRAEFIAALAQKVGPAFRFNLTPGHNQRLLAGSDVIIVALNEPQLNDFQVRIANLQRVVREVPSVPVIALIAANERKQMEIAIAAGAYDFFHETGSMDELRIVLRRAAQFGALNRQLQRVRVAAPDVAAFAEIVGANPKMLAIFQLASKVAATDATVLISGESGTGKELLAGALHAASPRAQEPFIAVACSALPESLVESELFGHERGAFTGAVGMRKGRFEAAEAGTIFLDEISELSPTMQVKLLRVLQQRTFERLGSNEPRPMRARVICASNQPLADLVRQNRFRLDLYYRLNTIELNLPPLRERKDDIPLLAYTFLQTFSVRHNRRAHRISPAANAVLCEYEWPGNVRQLQNVIERAVVLADSHEISLEHLPPEFASLHAAVAGSSFEEEVKNFKRQLIRRKLQECGYNKFQTAHSLGIARSSLHRLITELEIGGDLSSIISNASASD
jgi:DNA-binding NtrC family response regulator